MGGTGSTEENARRRSELNAVARGLSQGTHARHSRRGVRATASHFFGEAAEGVTEAGESARRADSGGYGIGADSMGHRSLRRTVPALRESQLV